jgi:uncharacterized protein YyaL (SSP411 family)
MNRLIHTTSPYLIQHAHYPVEWYPLGEEALAKAKTEDKPILISIGYAACHWCRIMAHESFEDLEINAIMNKDFVNIKVDREERPDLDGIYMQAVTAMTGPGGWPMTIFLTLDLKPFYAGTYFPPVARYNQPSFKDVLTGIIRAWREGRDEILRVGGQIAQRLQNNLLATGSSTGFTEKSFATAVNSLLEFYDWEYGGFGTATKFPQAMAVEFPINHAVIHLDKREEILKLVKHCLFAMSRGGMHDLIGGRFSRYSTYNLWRVSHFEKMLYDNALLTCTYLHAWQVTHEPILVRVVIKTLDFILPDLHIRTVVSTAVLTQIQKAKEANSTFGPR